MAAKYINNPSIETTKLVDDIKKNHTELAKITEVLEADKIKLRKRSEDIFFDDITNKAVHNNHEYHTSDEQIVTVNFKVKSRPMDKIGEKPAKEVLSPLFREHYEGLFEEKNHIKVISNEEDHIEQATVRPELFLIALKDDLSSEQLTSIVGLIPNLVKVSIRKPDDYAKAFPESVETTISVSIKNKFLESIAKMDAILLEKAKKFLHKFLKPSISTAVICGNRGKK